MNRDDILQAAAKGNASALEFLRVFARRAHWVDDCCDEPGPVDAGEAARSESEWLLTLSGNAFFLAHRAQLVPAMILALNAWADSERMPSPTCDVVKGQWHEVVWLVAFLVGGTEHLQDVTRKFRGYDFEPVKQNERIVTPKVVEDMLNIGNLCSSMRRKEPNGMSRE